MIDVHRMVLRLIGFLALIIGFKMLIKSLFPSLCDIISSWIGSETKDIPNNVPMSMVSASHVVTEPTHNNQLKISQGKQHLGLVIVGHVNAGISTTTGSLLFELGGLDESSLQERPRGVTIEVTTKEFFTDSYHYTIIDAPGHRDFVKNMISEAAYHDVALLLVPANPGDFETAMVKEATRQHARLLHLLGIEQIIVGINKMDDKSVNYSQDRYNEIKGEVDKMLTKIGYKTKEIPFIPISGSKGDNLTKYSDNMPWWKGSTVKVENKKVEIKTLLDALDKMVKPPKRDPKKPFRMPVSGVYKIKGVGDVITGRIVQGQIKPGAQVMFAITNVEGKAFSIEMHHKNVEEAQTGDNVGIDVKGLKKEKMPKVGDVMYLKSDPDPPKVAKQFTALCFVQDYPGQLKPAKNGKGKPAKDGKGGFTPSVFIRTGRAPCQLIKINWKEGKSTGNQKVSNPPYIEAGDTCEIIMEPKMPLVVADSGALARFAAMESNSVVMLGRVTQVMPKI